MNYLFGKSIETEYTLPYLKCTIVHLRFGPYDADLIEHKLKMSFVRFVYDYGVFKCLCTDYSQVRLHLLGCFKCDNT